MRFLALACDYDGTLAHNGLVEQTVVESLDRWRGAGRKLVMLTGRELADLRGTFSHLDRFDAVVVENGAMLFDPATGEETSLVSPPPAEFVAELRSRGVVPISVGRVIVATWSPHESTVLKTIEVSVCLPDSS